MGRLMKRLQEGDVLVSDGATGTFLQGRGLAVGEAPETWNLARPDDVTGMAEAYFGAGSDLVETNTFGGNRYRLRHAGLEARVADVNRTAAQLARSGAPEGRMVVGSIGPTGEFLAPLGLATEASLAEAFGEQAEALAEGGVDGLCVETMSAADEAAVAVKAAKQTGLPVIATMTFDKGPKGFATSMGVTIPAAVEALTQAGADVIGTNCGHGVAEMVEIVEQMGQLSDLPLMVQPNAGLPVMKDGQVVYEETPEAMAARYAELLSFGARIVGGCCGTGPDHIRAIVQAVRAAGK
jgi:5-methyltetrahydrofolate--homocysteine methyltransferase